MPNLLHETKQKLEARGKTIRDIKWFGTNEFVINEDIEGFLNIQYDNGWGGAEIPMDLIVVGDNFWLERHEYDGAEWWEYKEYPSMPEKEGDEVLETVEYEKFFDKLRRE